MAWSRLQSVASGAAGVSSVSATFTAANLSSGSKLICFVIFDSTSSASVSSVKDGAGNTFTQVPGGSASGTVGDFLLIAVYTLDTPAGDAGTKPAITATISASVSDVSILVQEISGLATGDAHDGTPGTVQEASAASLSQPAYTSSAANEFLTAFFGDDGGGETTSLPAGYTADANNINTSTTDNVMVGFKNSAGGAESGTWTNTAASGHAGFVVVAFKLPAGSAFVPLQPSRRLPYRTPGLPPVRRYRSLLPVPAQLNPPYSFAEIIQRRETWPRGMPRRGRVTFAVPPQLNPPYPFAELVQRRETWARGLPRRGRHITPVPAQLNPPYPFAEVRQWRQPRGLWPRRGHRFEPVPAQQAAVQAPAFTWQPLRHARIMLSRRGRGAVIVPGQDAPVTQARHPRPAVPARRPSRQTLPVPPQLNPPFPFAETTQRRQTWARALLRRGRLLLPWPQATQPAFSIGTLAAADKAQSALTAATTASALTAATVPGATLTATDQRTGGPG